MVALPVIQEERPIHGPFAPDHHCDRQRPQRTLRSRPGAEDSMKTTTDVTAALHDAAMATGFSGIIRVDRPGAEAFAQAYGFADRARRLAMTTASRFVVASVGKGFTALSVGALIDDGVLSLDSPVRPFLGGDLPLIDDAVTIEHLMAHTSGIGDYIDESTGSITDYVIDRPLHELDTTEAFIPVLDGRPQASAPGEKFAYCNSGFVVLALIAERASGVPFHDLVQRRVFAPAGMTASGYPRTDDMPGDLSVGYLGDDDDRTNILHLPVRGNGDGGAVTTAADLRSFWGALFEHRIVSERTLAALTEAQHAVDSEHMRYARGFWRGWDSAAVMLEGYDAGVSARTWFDPNSGVTGSIIANTSDGAWPVVGAVEWP
ncbi:serine hydrolase [Microbacterium sp. W4I20]|uniref:serine hydrolase domain-containing protein n=1 Tax=Microbacterium sp. W4I20 TaxID=3042262 RepID=UPI0027D7BAE2|nr:serine hydrolase domain-containing protein [Microbacterium sp. W4I20]